MTNRVPTSLPRDAPDVDDLLVTLDEQAGIVFANDAWSAELGHDPAAIFGRPFYDFVALDVRRNLERFLSDLPPASISASTILLSATCERKRYSATWRTRSSGSGPVLLDGTFVGAQARSINEPVADDSCETGAEWEWLLTDDIIVYSEAWSRLFGGPSIEQVCGPEEWFDRVLEEDIDRLDSALSAHLEGNTPSLDVTIRAVGDDGVIRTVRCTGRRECDANGVPRRIVGVVGLADAPATEGEQLDLRQALSVALDNGELSARYLPVVDPTTGVLVAVHCMPCWIDPLRGEVANKRLIQAAKALKREAAVEAAAIEALVAKSTAWEAGGVVRTGIRWSVNVDGLLSSSVDVAGLLSADGHSLSRWTLCISESTVADASDEVLDALRRCRARGAQVNVRDFGIGDMPLSYLKQDIVDRLCLHESLVS
ncbi:MAG: EAL domain-containing protein (putative c-di-GMP-specific phosphodiesterase class I), partial [Bradymonadia bacterium]